MPLFIWSRSFEVGFPEIDDQHRHLVEIANRLREAGFRKKGGENVDHVFIEFLNYMKKHFDYEIALLRKLESPDVEAHDQAHRELLSKLIPLMGSVGSNKQSVTVNLLQMTCDVLISHLLNVDKPSFDKISASQRKTA